ncbi:eaa protein [Salmonella enterica]|nr:eaa protein [Salmonella enterica]EIU6094697.1 eaa protein [Salmonella enterica]
MPLHTGPREFGRPQAYVDGWNACRAAMLQGAEPVSNRDELPYAQVKAAADLYALCWQSGEVVTYTPDPEKATIWLNNYSGTCVQEYVKLERLQETLSGNSPVIPDDWVMVPKEPTQAMIKAWLSEVANWRGHVAGYKAALAAAPQHEVK